METKEVMSGIFEEVSIEDILSFLQMTTLTGMLEVRMLDHELFRLYLESGEAIGCTSVSTAKSIGSEKSFKTLFISEDAKVTNDDLLKERTQDAVFRMINRQKGSYCVFSGTKCPIQEKHSPVNITALILEATRRVDEWGRLPDSFRDPETTFRIAHSPKSSPISITLEEWEVFFLAKNCSNLGEIWKARAHRPQIETSRILYSLSSVNLIEPKIEQFTDQPAEPKQLPSESRDPNYATGPISHAHVEAAIKAADLLTTLEDGHPKKPLLVKSTARLIEVGPGEQRTFELTNDTTKIGRLPDNEIVLDTASVSRYHAAIAKVENFYLLQDLESMNGVWVNGQRVQRCYLTGSEEIMIPTHRFRFELDFDISEQE